MYTKPTLERFGTLRELTQIGFSGTADLGPAGGDPGNHTGASH